MPAVLAAAIALFAAWLSFASFAVTAGAAARTALLPVDFAHLAVSVLAGAVTLAAAWRPSRSRRVLIALAPLAFIGLPWLPFRVPAAFLLWTGPILGLLWIACAIGVVAAQREPDVLLVVSAPPRLQCLYAGVASLVLFALAAWCAAPSIPGGDEPHYLVITQSLLYDHDLQIENNHRRGDYHAYFAGDLNPDFVQRGRNGAIYSIHAPGVPAIVLPAFAIGGYRGVVVFLLLVASAAAALAWWLAWRVTESSPAAWFGWASVALSPPFLVETYTVYPDGLGAAVVLTGVWALLRSDWDAIDGRENWHPWFLHGLALALLPWMHTRFSVIAATLGGLILVRLARTPNPVAKAIAFLSVPAASALAWLFFFTIVYGTPDPSAPYGRQAQNSFAYVSNGLGGLFLDQGFGLFATAPVLVAAVAGFARVRRLGVEYAVVLIPYVLAVATFAMWWAGWSGPARFLIPLVLPLAIPAACAWKARAGGRGARAVMAAALVFSLWLSAVMVAGGGGRLAYHARNENGATIAPWADWTSRAVDIGSALPAYVPLPVGTAVAARESAARAGTLTALPWITAFGIVVLIVRRRAGAAVGSLSAGVTICCATAAMACTTIVWHATGQDPVLGAASQLSALRTLASTQAIAVDVTGHRIVPASAYAASMAIDVKVAPSLARGAARGNRPLALFPGIPAGEYELIVTAEGSDGWVMTGIANDQFAIATEPLASVRSGIRLRFPVDVRSIVVRSDETARDAIRQVTLRPLGLVAANDRLTADPARRAVRYGAWVVYFLDDRAFAEPSGFWVGGARSTSIVAAPDAPAAAVSFAIRNAPVANRLTVTSGRWQDSVDLAPGEERAITVPIDPARDAGLIRLQSASGFRPSDQGGRDARFLGVFVKLN